MTDPPAHYEVVLERQAEKDLRRLPKEVLSRVDRILLGLAQEPRPVGCKKLRGYENLYRLRAGDWRIIYAIEEERLIVLVIVIAPRGQIYRDL